MDQNKNQILTPFNQIYSSRKAIKILLTLSLLCVLFSYSSSLFFTSFTKFYMRTFSYYYATDKNYIFLVCNGILILIIKNSGLFAISPANSDHFRNVHTKQNVQPRHYTTSSEHNANKIIDDQLKQYTSVSDVLESETGRDNSDTRREDKEKEGTINIPFTKQRENVNLVSRDEEKEEFDFVDEEEEEFVDLEELNKKCEDFIRKMKFGIKFEAQHHQLIMV